MIAEIVDVLIDELRDYYEGSGVVVEDYPDNPDTYILKASGAVLVAYAGTEFSPPDSSEVVRQTGDVQFQVVSVARNKRTHTGSYAMLDAIRNEVLGIEYREQRFSVVAEQFLEQVNGVWFYSQTFGIRQRVRQIKS